MNAPETLPRPPSPSLALRFERAKDRAVFRFVRGLVRRVRFERVRALGEALGELRFRIGWRARRRMEREIASLLDKPVGDAGVHALLREAYRSNDAAVLEILKLFDARHDVDRLLAHVQVDGIERLREALAAGRGAILLAGHAGNGALLVLRLVESGIPVSVVYREARMFQPGFFERGLSQYGIESILATEGLKAYGRMLAALKQRRVVYVMADQGTKKAKDGMVFRFLGKDMPMPAGPAQLARHARAPVLPVATLGARPRWHFEIEPPVPLGGATLEDDAATLLRASEALILRAPQWWSWHHRRWRHFRLASEARPAPGIGPR